MDLFWLMVLDIQSIAPALVYMKQRIYCTRRSKGSGKDQTHCSITTLPGGRQSRPPKWTLIPSKGNASTTWWSSVKPPHYHSTRELSLNLNFGGDKIYSNHSQQLQQYFTFLCSWAFARHHALDEINSLPFTSMLSTCLEKMQEDGQTQRPVWDWILSQWQLPRNRPPKKIFRSFYFF